MANRIPALFGRLFSLVICLSFLLGQTACNGGRQKPLPNNTTNPATPQIGSPNNPPTQGDGEAQPNASDTQAENTVITFTAHEFERSRYETLMAQFHEQNPTITVMFVPLPILTGNSTENYYQTLASTADTSLISGRSSQLGAYFRDLQPQMDMDADFRPDDFWPGALSACQDERGRVLGVPVNLFMSGIFYDEQAFQAAGLPFPQPGWTWDNLRKAAATLAITDVDGTRYGFADPTYASVVSPLLGMTCPPKTGPKNKW